MDRKLCLSMLFRLGFDFLQRDNLNNTPFDRALENWSLFCINFMIDYSSRPLKTNHFLKNNGEFSVIDLIPSAPKTKLYEIESEYIPYKLCEIRNKQQNTYDSLAAVWKKTYLLDIKNYIK